MSGRVFISYRRDLSSDTAGLIAMALRNQLPRCDPFLDVDKIKSDQFYQRIETELALSDAVAILIPPDWEFLENEDGIRIQQEGDFVRHEVATALQRGQNVIPVLVDRESLPDKEDLPEDLHELALWHAASISSAVGPADVFILTEIIRPKLPDRLSAALLKTIALSPSLFILPYILSFALIMFAAHLMQVHFISVPYTTYFGDGAERQIIDSGVRDLGFFQALNWTVVLMVCWPLLIYLFHQLLRESQALFVQIRARGLVVFVEPSGQQTPRPPEPVWRHILKYTSILMVFLLILTTFLSGYNWYQFVGKWPLTDFPMADFLNESTGPDWQVAWSLETFEFPQNINLIKALALVCYELYNLGWIASFCVFVYAIFLISELDNIAQSSGDYKAEKLVLDISSPHDGGLEQLNQIHRLLAIITLVAFCAMYLMAIRNFFLPPGCQAIKLSDGSMVTAHCYHTLGIFATSTQALWDVVYDLFRLDFSSIGLLTALPNTHNSFTMGSFYTVIVIFALFIFATLKLLGFIQQCRVNTTEAASDVARPMVRRIRLRTILLIPVAGIGALATVFPMISVLFFGALVAVVLVRI